MADQTHDMEEARQSKRDQDRQRPSQGGAGQDNAKEGYHRDWQGREGQHLVAQRLVIKLFR